jgi:hypothetical protein
MEATKISMFLMSLKDFQNEQLASDVINTMNLYPEFSPNKCDTETPLKFKFEISDINHLINMWMNKGINDQWVKEKYASGTFIAERSKKWRSGYFASWKKSQQVNFNHFSIDVSFHEAINSDFLEKFMSLCKYFIDLIEPVYGAIGIVQSDEYSPINLRVRLPELKWITLFGQPYIDLFGKEKLAATPCFKVHEINDQTIGIQLTESIYNEIPSSLKKSIKMYLGEDAFVEEGKGVKRYKTGVTPIFDFSGILFDSRSPIVEPQIYKRDR